MTSWEMRAMTLLLMDLWSHIKCSEMRALGWGDYQVVDGSLTGQRF